MTQPVIGVDIGGTKIAAGLVLPDGTISHAQTTPTPTGGQAAILQAVIALCRPLRATDTPPVAIGVGAAGQIDTVRGVVTYANENLPGWAGAQVGAALQTALGLPVVVDNDVNAMAYGESRIGAGAGFRHILYITVGTGVGGALVQDGVLWRGAHHSAGEIAYLVAGWDGDKPLGVEQRTSGPAMTARYRQRAGLPPDSALTLVEITARAQAGDALAREVIREGAQVLGVVLAAAVCLLDPEIVIIGGGVPGIGALWWQPFESALRDHPLPAPQQVNLARARFDVNAVLIGAALLAASRHSAT